MIKNYYFNSFSIEENFKRNVNLIMQIAKQGFSYFCFNVENHNEIILTSYNHDNILKPDYAYISEIIENFHKENNILKLKISYQTEHFTLVPEFFFSKEHSQKLLEYNFGKIEGFVAFENKINGQEIYNVFSVEENLMKVLPKNILKKSFFADSTFFICKALKYRDKSEIKKIHLNLKPNKIEICVTENGKLRFVNSFNCTIDKDIIYFLLNVYEQEKMHLDHHKLILYGFNKINNKIIESLNKFIKNIEFEAIELPFNQLSTISDIEQFDYLLSLYK